MRNKHMGILDNVGHWSLNRQSVILLSCVLLVILLVQILPQVDLLDTAFHLGTAPIALHAQATARPILQILLFLFTFSLSAIGNASQDYQHHFVVEFIRGFDILHHSFRC